MTGRKCHVYFDFFPREKMDTGQNLMEAPAAFRSPMNSYGEGINNMSTHLKQEILQNVHVLYREL